MTQYRITTERPSLESRKAEFAALNRFIGKRGDGWLVSVVGDPIVRLQVLPNSDLPQILRSMGHVLHEDGEGERLISNAVTEAVLVAGSTRVAFHTQHAGVVKTLNYTFRVP
jgi:hypothetical protein